MGRKANVAVARAKARAVGVMVAGWEGWGDILVKTGDNFINVYRRETHILAEIRF